MQKTVILVVSAAVIGLGAGLGASLLLPKGPDEAEIRAMIGEEVESRLARRDQSESEVDVAELIESQLMADPRILQRVSAALEEEMRAEERQSRALALAEIAQELYEDPDHIVLGNPEGDVTLVELFDYNCGFCRQVVPDVLALIDEDPDLRVILKEFPILSQGSVDAARIGVLVNRAEGVDYLDYHTALFSGRGSIDRDAALAAAQELGLSRLSLELDMNAQSVTDVIARSYSIAQALEVSGTPTFIIGDEVIAGAVPKEDLELRIENMRACGSTACG